MKVLSAQQTRGALPWDRLIAALDDGFRATLTAPLRHHHSLSNPGAEDDTILLMPAWRDDWGGVKLVNVHPGNAALGLASISSTYVLFDRRTGRHELILDGGELTARRTAAASALAALLLARPGSRRHLLVGAGRVCANIPPAYAAVLPIAETEIWSRTTTSAERLAADLTAAGHSARAVTDLEQAVSRADIVTCATLSRTPLLRGAWLREGQHVDLIGSFTPQMREADDEAIRRAALFVDTEHALVESGDLRIPLDTGLIAKNDIRATLTALCRQEAPGRGSDAEITLFKGVGHAGEDLAAAVLARQMTAAS